ncbi:hypothetical protein ABIF86_006274 [Bradyrhizobium japonicum]
MAALNDGNCLSLPRSAGSVSLLGSLKISPHAWSRCCSRFFTRIAAARPKRRSGGGNERGILGEICSVGYRISVAQNTANMSIPSYKIFHVTEIQKMAYVSPIQVHP